MKLILTTFLFCVLIQSVNAQSINDLKGKWMGKFFVHGANGDTSYDFKFEIMEVKSNDVVSVALGVQDKNSTPSNLKWFEQVTDLIYLPQQNAIQWTSFVRIPGSKKKCTGQTIFKLEKGNLVGNFIPDQPNCVESVAMLGKDGQVIAPKSNNILEDTSKSNLNNTTLYQNSDVALSKTETRISPNVKVIDADEFFNFSNGVARVTKGTAWGLINSSGDFIIPYNKWVLNKDSKAHFITAVSFVTGKEVLLNTKGKTVLTEGTKFQNPDDDGYVLVNSNNSTYYINADGDKINFINKFSFYPSFRENLALIHSTKDKAGFIDRKYNVVIQPEYDFATNFSEGLAVVGNKNEFGEMHYGFIDKQGKVVIPLKFSILPHDFHLGLSLVEAKDISSFKYAYINKHGDVAFKVKISGASDESLTPGFEYNNSQQFLEWGTYNGTYFVDTSGTTFSDDELLAKFHIPVRKPRLFQFLGYNYATYSPQGAGTGTGIINFNTNSYLLPIFKFPANQLFDAESKLILGSNYITARDEGKIKKIVGYINTEGVFVIIQADKSKW